MEYRYTCLSGQLQKYSDIEHENSKWHTMTKYELTVDAPCPALTGALWDVYFELHGHKVPRYIGIVFT